MSFGCLKTEAEKKWEENYGHLTSGELKKTVITSIGAKMSGVKQLAEKEYQDARSDEIGIPYAEIIKGIAREEKAVESLKGKPERLIQDRRKALINEYDKLKENGFWDNNKELWISKKLEEYIQSDDYKKIKTDLKEAINNYSSYTALKDIWEKNNADIIKAERIRSKRAELLQADPETLKALGIIPDPTFTVSKQDTVAENTPEAGYERALRSLHPSASDTEIATMLKQI